MQLRQAGPQDATTTIRVLIVDDLPEICDLLKRTVRRLRDPRIALTTEINSQRALELVAAEPYDVVVSDYRMREVNGLKLLAAARAKNPAGRRVLLTGYSELPVEADALRAAGLDVMLQKPVLDEDLQGVLRAVVAGSGDVLDRLRRDAREREAELART